MNKKHHMSRGLAIMVLVGLCVGGCGDAGQAGRAGDTVRSASPDSAALTSVASDGEPTGVGLQLKAPPESPSDLRAAPAPTTSYRRQVPMSGGTITVPATFTGMHFHRWPSTYLGASPAPTYGYGTVRSHNYDPRQDGRGIHWYAIHKSEGADPVDFDWDLMDFWVTQHCGSATPTCGKRLIYTLYGTPTWCSTNASQLDPYNYPGGDSPPKPGYQCVTDFVTALLVRYGDKIAMIEIWNEPDSSFSGQSHYWRGAADELAQLAQTVYRAVKSFTNLKVRVVWPPFVEWYRTNEAWRSNLEYGNALKLLPGRVPGDPLYYAEDFAFHFYGYSRTLDDLMNNQESVRNTLAALGISHWDVYNTEMGFGTGWGQSLSATAQAELVTRWMLLSAAYGNKAAVLYSHDGSNLGNPSQNPKVSKAINDVHLRLQGKTIVEGGVLRSGAVRVKFSDGSAWEV